MDEEKLVEFIKKELKPNEPVCPFIRPAIKFHRLKKDFKEWEKAGKKEVDIAMKILKSAWAMRSMKEEKWEEEWEKGIDTFPIEFTISQEFYIKKFIKPEVEKLRESIFGRKTPPFSTLEEAVEWIEATHKKEKENWQKTRKNRDVNLLEELRRLSRLSGKMIKLKAYILRYPHPKKGTGLISVVQGGTLYKLQSETERLAKATFYNQATLVAYTLLDCEFLPPSIRWTQHLHYPLQIPALELEIPRPITKKEWDKLYSKVVKPTFQGEKTSSNEIRLYRLIERLGGVPEKGKGRMKFWEKVCEEWKRQYPESGAFPTPDSMRMAYKRKIAPKLDKLEKLYEEKKKEGDCK